MSDEAGPAPFGWGNPRFGPPTARIIDRVAQAGDGGRLQQATVDVEIGAPPSVRMRYLVVDIDPADSAALIRDAAFTLFAEDIAALALHLESLVETCACDRHEIVWAEEVMRLR